jgi:hypothetical protein
VGRPRRDGRGMLMCSIIRLLIRSLLGAQNTHGCPFAGEHTAGINVNDLQMFYWLLVFVNVLMPYMQMKGYTVSQCLLLYTTPTR